jgi:hypothetical protein
MAHGTKQQGTVGWAIQSCSLSVASRIRALRTAGAMADTPVNAFWNPAFAGFRLILASQSYPADPAGTDLSHRPSIWPAQGLYLLSQHWQRLGTPLRGERLQSHLSHRPLAVRRDVPLPPRNTGPTPNL